MRTKPKEQKYGSWWRCPNCGGNPESEFTHAEFIRHIQDVHGIDPKVTKGHREMTMHVDGSEYYSSRFVWTIAGLKFYQSTTNKRSKDDMMNWE